MNKRSQWTSGRTSPSTPRCRPIRGARSSKYDWDIDGDANYEIQDGNSTYTSSFSTVRDGEVGVRVWDNQGLQDEAHMPVKIDAQIDFKPSWASTAGSYAADTGAAYTDARGYGWVRQDSLSNPTHTPLNLSANATDRDPLDDDPFSQEQDTTIFMQYPTTGSNPRLVDTPGAFEIAVPCGTYSVKVSVGDSACSSLKKKPGDISNHRILVENEVAIQSFLPESGNKFETATKTVNVCDGRLTVDARGGTNTKLNYVDVRRKDGKVNFQPWWSQDAQRLREGRGQRVERRARLRLGAAGQPLQPDAHPARVDREHRRPRSLRHRRVRPETRHGDVHAVPNGGLQPEAIEDSRCLRDRRALRHLRRHGERR